MTDIAEALFAKPQRAASKPMTCVDAAELESRRPMANAGRPSRHWINGGSSDSHEDQAPSHPRSSTSAIRNATQPDTTPLRITDPFVVLCLNSRYQFLRGASQKHPLAPTAT